MPRQERNIPLIRGTIPVQCHPNLTIILVLMGKRQPRPERHLSTHNATTPVKVILSRVHVHRPTLPLACPRPTTHQLRNHLVHRLSVVPQPSQVQCVVPITGDDRVLLVQRHLQPHPNGLLPIVQVTEPQYLLCLVQHIAANLHPAHAIHLLEHTLQLSRRDRDGGRGHFVGDRVQLVRQDWIRLQRVVVVA